MGMCGVLQDDLFLPWTSVMQCTMKLLKCLKVTSSIHGFPLHQKCYQYASFSIPKMVFMVLLSDGTVLIFFFLGRCVMPFHALLFCFCIKVMRPAFVTCYNAVKKVVTFDSILLQQLRWNVFPEVCVPLLAGEEPIRQKLSSIPNFLPSHGAHVSHSSIAAFCLKV